MDYLRSSDSKDYVLNFTITPQEVVTNIQLFKTLINKFYTIFYRAIRLNIYNAPPSVVPFNYNLPLEVFAYIAAVGQLINIPMMAIARQPPPAQIKINQIQHVPFVNPAQFEVAIDGGIINKPYIPGLVDPLILNIFIAKNQFHNIVAAVKAIQNIALRNTIIGIMKYSLLNDKEVLDLMSEYVMSYELKATKAIGINTIFVKLKGKESFYTIDYRLLSKFLQ